MKKHYDMVIANPPYSCGNQVVRAILDGVDFDEFINLMPASKYKGGDLYKNVKKVMSVDPSGFQDAAIGDSLIVAVIGKEEGNYATYDEFCNEFRDERFVEFYKANAKTVAKYGYVPSYSTGKKEELPDVAVSFMLTSRTIQNGTHSEENGAADISYNLNHDASNIPWSNRSNTHSCMFIVFNSPIEKQNLCRFWYRNPLQNALIKGLNQSSGRCTAAIPNLDWTKDRDYENATLEDIMNWLKEDNE